jgi:hypothetical protein
VTYETIEGNEVMEGGREKRRRITGRRSTGRWRKRWRREEEREEEEMAEELVDIAFIRI